MNSLFVIFPYKYEGCWVFDDERVGLFREPFVLGIDTMLDKLTANIPNAEAGVKIIFSPSKFPGSSVSLEWRREESGGNWYYAPEYALEGWLCPALFKYFDKAPVEIHVRVEPNPNLAKPKNPGAFSPALLQQLLPLATAWAEEMEEEILSKGTLLSAAQLRDARAVGLLTPEKVRLLAVSQIPIPGHPLLIEAGQLTGLISAHTAGMTLRYGIFIRKDCWNDRALIAHELVHVHQYERLGGIEAFLRQYLWECLTEGYASSALEQEAVQGAASVMNQS